MNQELAELAAVVASPLGDLCRMCEGAGVVGWELGDRRWSGPCPVCVRGSHAMGIPLRFAFASLEDFPGTAFEQLRSWNYRAPGLFLFGGVGRGKTHAAAAHCKRAAGRGLRASFIVTADFLKARQATFDSHSDALDPSAALMSADLVVLDDLAGERGGDTVTSWAVGELLQLIDHLYTTEKALSITSNYDLAGIAERLGDRIASRIAEMTRPFPMRGRDRRLEVVK